MGSFIGKAMDENMVKQQEFMLKTQQLTMERQLAMQNEMRERQMALMVAKSRDFFWYWMTFDSIATLGLTSAVATANINLLMFWQFVFMAFLTPTFLFVHTSVGGAFRSKKFGLLIPLVPLTIVTAYQWDLAYGPKIERLREMADRILDEEQVLLEMPHGMPTFELVDAARLTQKTNKPYKPGHDIFL